MSSEVPPTHSIPFTIANAGLADLTLTSCTLDNPAWPDYWSATFPALPLTLPPGGTQDFTVDFIYKYDNTYSTKTATVTLASDDPEQPSFVLNLTGTTS